MTFYEAALRVLESAGHPLHYLEITQQSIAQNLLSHVGKTPEQTMLSRLAAMARRPRDRKVVVTAKDTFGLVDWGLPEDAAALAVTGVVEPNPEEALPPLRPLERHPESRSENVRAVGRGERDRKRRRDEDEDRGGKRRRFPPIAEVAFEILSESEGGLKPEELAAKAVERELAGGELGTEQILHALLDDNQRRIDAGRRPQFLFDGATKQLTLERAGAPSEVPAADLQASFAAALGIPMEGGRPALPRAPERAGESTSDLEVAQTAKAAAKDSRRAMARVLRRKLSELDPGTFEKSVVRMMQGLGFRDLKVAKRAKEGPLLTARKREGSVELRFAVKVARGGAPVDRRAVQELRRDLGHYASQVGLYVSPGDVRGDARAEAQSQGALVMLWCSEGLAEKFFEARVGVSVQQVELYEIDERFFEQAHSEAEEARARRDERQRERGRPEEGRPAPAPGMAAESAVPAERLEEAVSAEHYSEATVSAERTEEFAGAAEVAASVEDDEEEGEFEDEEEQGEPEAAGAAVSAGRPEGVPGQPGQPGQPGERKRRRRRRRGRRGRGPRPGEAPLPGQSAQPGADAGAAPAAAAPADSGAPPPAPAPPPPAAGARGSRPSPPHAPSRS